ncbi:MAG: hypothetical protein AAF653_14930, partial [Chloroflexota bacterium]
VERDGSGLALGLRLAVLMVGAASVVATVFATWTRLEWAFIVIPVVLVGVWAVMLAVGLWLMLVVGVRARILPRHVT